MIGKIYRMYNSETCYIGSTICKYMSQRKAVHTNKFKEWIEGNYHWVSSYILYMNDEPVEIELLEEIEYEDKKELHLLEAYYMTQYDCVNQLNPDGKWKERRKEKIQCECGSMITRCNISNHRKTNKHLSKAH